MDRSCIAAIAVLRLWLHCCRCNGCSYLEVLWRSLQSTEIQSTVTL